MTDMLSKATQDALDAAFKQLEPEALMSNDHSASASEPLKPRTVLDVAFTTEVTETINTREHTHGNYVDTARIAQRMKLIIHEEMVRRQHRGQPPLQFTQVESLELMATKIARIIAGDNAASEHWHDIGGYAGIANKK